MDTAEQRWRDRIGTVIRGKYTLERLLGVGGMAAVYAATHRNKKRFAVKILHPELSFNDEVRRRFLREGYVANTVDHPGAVAVLDDDTTEDGAAFLVMEFLEGVAADGLLERAGSLTVAAALAIGHQLADVLAAAHDKGIVHRDVKPANLFVLRDGTLKVLDFGIARVRDATQAAASATATGMMMGTPAYLPPEQAMAKHSEIDGRTDVWAAGATLFTLLSGKLVHEGDNATQMVIAAATKKARSLAAVMPNAPTAVVELVDRALAFEPAERFQTARELRDAIERAARETLGSAISKSALVDVVSATPGQQATPALPGNTVRMATPVPRASAPATTMGPQAITSATKERRTWWPIVLASLSVAGFAAATLAVLHRDRTNQSQAPQAASTITPMTTPVIEATAAPVTAASEPTATIARALPPAAVVSARPDRPIVAHAARPQPTPSASAAPSSTAAQKRNCDPPYVIDSLGKHYKPECFQ